MNKHPKTIKQLNKRLEPEYLEAFPYGKHKNELVEQVVVDDPNYVVWWSETIEGQPPIRPNIVAKARRNYRRLESSGMWIGTDDMFDHWGDPFDEDVDVAYEAYGDSQWDILGDPWDR